MPLLGTRGAASARGFGLFGGKPAYNIQYLVVAGGGGGGAICGCNTGRGGGGAGGYRAISCTAVTP